MAITGGGSGIGKALAHCFHKAGAQHVAVIDLDGELAEAVASEIQGSAHALDVSNEGAIREMVAQIQGEHGSIDIFVSNAGYVTAAGIEESNEAIGRMWDVNVMSHIYAARAVLPSMIEKGRGYLLQTASAAGLITMIGSMSYSMTKHAAVALAEWLALSHYHQGIRVSVLCPQTVRTNISTNSPSDFGKKGMLGMSVDEMSSDAGAEEGVLEPEDVASLCLEAIDQERFLVLPHPEVAVYAQRRVQDFDRYLAGMRTLQNEIYQDGALPGDKFLSQLKEFRS